MVSLSGGRTMPLSRRGLKYRFPMGSMRRRYEGAGFRRKRIAVGHEMGFSSGPSQGGELMIKSKVTMMAAMATLFGGCAQNMPAAYTGGPPDPNSVTTFTLSLTPDSLVNCWQANPGMDRPMTMTVQSNSGTLLTGGGI